MSIPNERCTRELDEIRHQDPVIPAWLTTLGECDWIWELELLQGSTISATEVWVHSQET